MKTMKQYELLSTDGNRREFHEQVQQGRPIYI